MPGVKLLQRLSEAGETPGGNPERRNPPTLETARPVPGRGHPGKGGSRASWQRRKAQPEGQASPRGTSGLELSVSSDQSINWTGDDVSRGVIK